MINYPLVTADTILTHSLPRTLTSVGLASVRLLHDFAGDLTKSDIDVLVASGDYLATLATSLDSLSQSLESSGNETDHVILEKIINTLLYIETKYRISKR
jgi:soluble P-type ATPase